MVNEAAGGEGKQAGFAQVFGLEIERRHSWLCNRDQQDHIPPTAALRAPALRHFTRSLAQTKCSG